MSDYLGGGGGGKFFLKKKFTKPPPPPPKTLDTSHLSETPPDVINTGSYSVAIYVFLRWEKIGG